MPSSSPPATLQNSFRCSILLKSLLISCFLFATTSVSIATNPNNLQGSLRSTIAETRECSDDSLSSLITLGLHPSSEHQAFFQPPPHSSYRVPLPHPNPTKSFWLDTPGANPLADEGSTGSLSTRDADVCIIGSGITGVSTAWHLNKKLSESLYEDTRRRTSVVILEARRFCSGATGRNGGHLTQNIFSSFHTLSSIYNTSEALKSYDLEAHTANSLIKFIQDRGLEGTVDLVRGGHVSVFRTPEEEVEARRDWEGVRDARREAEGDSNEDIEGVEWIDADEMHRRYGIDRKLNYSGARFVGHNLWPCKLVTQLYKDISGENINLSLHTKTPVTHITRLSNSNNRRWELSTPRGEVSCNYVIHATNGYAAHLLPFLSGSSIPDKSNIDPLTFGLTHVHPPTSLPRGAYGIKPTRGQVGAVRASANATTFPWLESWDDGPKGWNYWFPRYQDTSSGANDSPLIILGGERRVEVGDGEVGNADDSVVNPLVSRALRRFLPGFYKELFDAEGGGWEMEWTGVMAFTKTSDPFVGPVANPLIPTGDQTNSEGEYEGQYIAAGYTGHGMPRAYACAEAVAGMIVAKMKGEPWKKPRWLPERYLTWATEP